MILVRALCTGLLVVGCLPDLARASGQRPDVETPVHERWVPSLTTSIMLYNWTAQGNISNASTYSVTGTNNQQVAAFQLGLELNSPGLEFLPAAPRLVLAAGGQVSPRQEKNFLSSGEFEPYEPQRTVNALNQSGTSTSLNLIPGQGSEVSGTYQNGGWYAGIGLAFGLPDRDSRLRLKATLNYLGERVEAAGKVVLVERPDGGLYEVISKAGSGLDTFHNFGPGLEVDLILSPGRTLAVSFYGQVQFLWAPGNRTIRITSGSGSPIFNYTRENFGIRGGFGLRVAWLSAFSN